MDCILSKQEKFQETWENSIQNFLINDFISYNKETIEELLPKAIELLGKIEEIIGANE